MIDFALAWPKCSLTHDPTLPNSVRKSKLIGGDPFFGAGLPQAPNISISIYFFRSSAYTSLRLKVLHLDTIHTTDLFLRMKRIYQLHVSLHVSTTGVLAEWLEYFPLVLNVSGSRQHNYIITHCIPSRYTQPCTPKDSRIVCVEICKRLCFI